MAGQILESGNEPWQAIELTSDELTQAFKIAKSEKFKNTKSQEDFDPFSIIELTEEEEQHAIKKAKQSKLASKNENEYWEKLKEPKKYPKYTAPKLYNIIKINGERDIKGFTLDEYNNESFKKLCLYFSGDPRFEQYDESYSFKKGLLLYGAVGCGKTTFMKLFTDNQLLSYKFYSCRKIAQQYAKEGFDSIDNYSKKIKLSANTFGHSEFGACFDDFGIDDERKHFGDSTNVMADILLNRYEDKLYKYTHITTNLTTEMIKSSYGERLSSRFSEMFNVVCFDKRSPDRRK